MDEITKKRIIIDKVIDFLKEGNYVGCTNMYCGNYSDGVKSKDRDKITKDNIYFVNMLDIRTVNGTDVKLKKLAIKAEFKGKEELIPVWVGIDVSDWKIYLKL